MSISFRKLEELIDEEIQNSSDQTDDEKSVLSALCKQLYMIEAGDEAISAQQKIKKMQSELANKSDRLSASRHSK